MTRILPWVALALSLTALALSWSRRPPAAPVAETAHAAQAFGDETLDTEGAGNVEARLAALEWAVSDVARRLAASGKVDHAAPGAPSLSSSRQEIDALREDVDALLTGDALAGDHGRERLKEVVRKLQDEVFLERMQDRIARQEQERSDRLAAFIEQARLSRSQAHALTEVLDQETQARRALLENWRSGSQEGAQAFQEVRALRASTGEQAKAILDAEQYAAFEEMRRQERRERRMHWAAP